MTTNDDIVARLDLMLERMSPQPLANLFVSEMISKEDLDGNDKIFGIDFILNIPIDVYPDVIKQRVEELTQENLPTLRKISIEEYISGLPEYERDRIKTIIMKWIS